MTDYTDVVRKMRDLLGKGKVLPPELQAEADMLEGKKRVATAAGKGSEAVPSQGRAETSHG